VNISQDCSWCWRRLLKLQSLARSFIKFEVGDGSNIHMWQDNWHPLGVLFERYGFRIIYDPNSRLKSKLSTVLCTGSWCWKPARSEDLVDIQCCLPEVHLGPIDELVWTIGRKGSYVSSNTCYFLRDKKRDVDW
jgi:hypothetical protein